MFTEVKYLCDKERFLNLKQFKNRQAMAKIRLSSRKLASRTAKWYNTNREEQFSKFCNQGQVENEVYFF